MNKNTETNGLKRLVADPKAAKELCPNCKCLRHGPCGCKKKDKGE